MQGWRDIPLPEALTQRPKDDRGFPITFVTLITPDGKPDFTTIDARRIIDCIQGPLCAMCGTDLIDMSSTRTEKVAFIGGPRSIENRNFLDPPMHEECAAYAMQVCPHIVHDTSRYKKQDLSDGLRTQIDAVSDERPDRFGMLVVDADYVGLGKIDQPGAQYGQPVFLVETDAEVEVRWQGEPQFDDDGEELLPYFETRVFRLPEHQDPETDEPCLETVVATHGRHRVNGADKLITMLCIGCNVLRKLEPVTDPDEIERLRNPPPEED